MKRTTERSDLASKQVPEYISGCRQFEGEDLGKSFFINRSLLLSIAYRARVQEFQSIQKEWIKEQSREHEFENNRSNREESEYAEQTDNITRMRGMLEDEMTMKKKNQLKEMQEYNQRLADEKRNREKNWKDNQED